MEILVNKLHLSKEIENKYTSKSQRIRVMTEEWVKSYILCPACGFRLEKYPNNKPVADFFCINCLEDFELKATNGLPGVKVVNGAFSTLISRLHDKRNPNLFLLSYSKFDFSIINFLVIPKQFFTSEIIEKRTPLKNTARRAGWTGCNIMIGQIPEFGKISYINNGILRGISEIVGLWKATEFVASVQKEKSKGWLFDVMRCVDSINKEYFSLNDIYKFSSQLKKKHPDNNNVEAKIRQQLQLLRENGYLEFINRGIYRICR